MSDSVSIRTMTFADCEPVAGLFSELDVYHQQHLPWLFQTPEIPVRDTAFFEGILENDETAILVAEEQSVVGFVHFAQISTPTFPVFVPQLRVLIDNIYVAPSWRRAGIARMLMESAEEWASERNVEGIDLSVYEFNQSAREFFSAMGYSTLSRRMSKLTPTKK